MIFEVPRVLLASLGASLWTTFSAPEINTIFGSILSLKTAPFWVHLGAKIDYTFAGEGVLEPTLPFSWTEPHFKLLLELILRSELELDW